MAGMEPAAVVPNHEAPKGARRPSTLTLSSRSLKSPEPSPTRSRDSEGELGRTATAEQESWGPFTFVGPERKRFHANRQHAPYPFPCGMEELSRMNMLHYVYYHIFDKRHYLTQFNEGELPKRVLDIGCGTGIWIHDVAKQWTGMGHTNVEFVGIDLVPIQTPMRDLNVKFHHLNILTDELPFEDGYFDYVHIRGLAAGIPENCWLGDHKTASGVLDKALRVLRVAGYFEVVETNLLFSYYDTSANPPRQFPPDIIYGKDDTIAPLLSKVFTGRQSTATLSMEVGINPFPISVLSAQFTFLPLTQLHSVRNLIPVSRFNVSLTKSEQSLVSETSSISTSHNIDDSVARVAGYIAAGDTYSSLKPELIRILKEQGRADAYGEFRRIERLTHRRWLGMENTRTRSESVISDFESARKVQSGESSQTKSIASEESQRPGCVNVYNGERGTDDALDKAQLKREVGAWWGRKCPD